jgi:hypothetical protein
MRGFIAWHVFIGLSLIYGIMLIGISAVELLNEGSYREMCAKSCLPYGVVSYSGSRCNCAIRKDLCKEN